MLLVMTVESIEKPQRVSGNTFSVILKVSGSFFPLTLAMFSKVLRASSSRPLAISHLGDSGKKLHVRRIRR